MRHSADCEESRKNAGRRGRTTSWASQQPNQLCCAGRISSELLVPSLELRWKCRGQVVEASKDMNWCLVTHNVQLGTEVVLVDGH